MGMAVSSAAFYDNRHSDGSRLHYAGRHSQEAGRHSQEGRCMGSNSRASMIRSAAALFGSRGLTATSFSDVLADSGAPRGSIYHHFPGGKKQLAQDAISWTSEQVLTHLRACPADTAPGVLAWFIDLWRQSVQVSGGSAGCPVAGIAIDTAAADDLIGAAQAAFSEWAALLASQLQTAGGPAHRAGPM